VDCGRGEVHGMEYSEEQDVFCSVLVIKFRALSFEMCCILPQRVRGRVVVDDLPSMDAFCSQRLQCAFLCSCRSDEARSMKLERKRKRDREREEREMTQLANFIYLPKNPIQALGRGSAWPAVRLLEGCGERFPKLSTVRPAVGSSPPPRCS
jgi:hypothetical protein